MSISDVLRETAHRMFAAASGSLADCDQRLEWAAIPDYWRSLAPNLSVERSADPSELQGDVLTEGDAAESNRVFAVDGYFQTPPALGPGAIQCLRHGIERVRRAGWPPIFSFVYDEFWQATRSRPVIQIVRQLLGTDVRQLPHVWAHFVAGHRGAAGWEPHMDGKHRPRRITVWTALTDATLDNGCIHVVPRSAVPPGIAESFGTLTTIDWNEACILLQNCRALPCAAGSLLGWDLDVIHWGAACRRATAPRMSISFGFISGDESPLDDEQTPMEIDPLRLPTFLERLNMIGRAILTYDRFDPTIACYRELAQRLVGVTGHL